MQKAKAADLAISVQGLSKNYRVHKKTAGLIGTVRDMFTRSYETVKAVQGVSFAIERGEVIGFIGPNGAGKTTTLKCLSGLLHPTSGTLQVLGFQPFERKHEFLRQISLVMGQKNQLWWDLPAMDTFLLNKEIYGVTDTAFDKTLANLVELLDVSHLIHTPVRKLSLGQRMKMEIIAALIHSPQVLFLDEPTIGLDVIMQKTIRDFLQTYNKEYNATIILTSHYMKDVEALCKRVVIINHGTLLYDGQLSSVIKKHAPYKLITVRIKKDIPEATRSQYGETYLYEYPQWVIKVPAKKVGEVASKILKTFSVEDVIIEDPEIEDVISEIFVGGKK